MLRAGQHAIPLRYVAARARWNDIAREIGTTHVFALKWYDVVLLQRLALWRFFAAVRR